MRNKRLESIIDGMIIESILDTSSLKKNADSGTEENVFNKALNYFKEKFSNVENSKDKISIITEFLAPGIITMIGGPVAGIVFKVLEGIFGFNIGQIFSHLVSSISNMITKGSVNDSDIQFAASSAVESNMPPDPTEDTFALLQKLSYDKLTWRDSKLLKIALNEFILINSDLDFYSSTPNLKFIKNAAGSSLAQLFSIKNIGAKFLISLLSWITKAALIAGGFMIAEDLMKYFTNPEKEKSSQTNNMTPVSTHVSTQKTFAQNPNYVEQYNNTATKTWIVPVNPNNIGDVLIEWAKLIYPDLTGHENSIKSSTLFNDIVNVIKKYNAGETSNMTFIPNEWKSTKQIVDQFIDDVASNVGSFPTSIPDLNEKKPSINL